MSSISSDDDQGATEETSPNPPNPNADEAEAGKVNKRNEAECDFEVMMAKRRLATSKRRKRQDIDVINDNDDLICYLIAEMRNAADEDRDLNMEEKPATKKVTLLPTVLSQLKKHDLQQAFLENNVLAVLTDWLAPMPDRSLPTWKIRESLLQLLSSFPAISRELLKESGIGKAIMYLYRHPKETKENKDIARKLINQWARPIFKLSTDFKALSKEERAQRDLEHRPPRAQQRTQTVSHPYPIGDAEPARKKPRPGQVGWIPRAEIPKPSLKDYVIRPTWSTLIGDGKRDVPPRLEEHLKTFMKMQKSARKAFNKGVDDSALD